MRRILSELIKHNLTEAREGAGGGFKLCKNPDGIKVTDIIKIFQGNIQLSECMFRKKLCDNRKTCVLRKEINRIEKLVTKEFANITIGTLLRKI